MGGQQIDRRLGQRHVCRRLYRELRNRHGIVDGSENASRIHNQVRAFNPWPGTVTRFRGNVCKVLKSRVSAETAAGDPGSIQWDRHGLRVVCGNRSLLELLEVQPENRKAVSGIDFANGARIQPGDLSRDQLVVGRRRHQGRDASLSAREAARVVDRELA